MKRKIISILLALSILLFSPLSFAAWTSLGATLSSHLLSNGSKVHIVTIHGIAADDTDQAEFDLSTYLTDDEMNQIRYGQLYAIEYKSGVTDPAGNPAFALDNANGSSLITLSGTTVDTMYKTSTDLGINPYLDTDLQIDIGSGVTDWECYYLITILN